jgi:hypothetical protein
MVGRRRMIECESKRGGRAGVRFQELGLRFKDKNAHSSNYDLAGVCLAFGEPALGLRSEARLDSRGSEWNATGRSGATPRSAPVGCEGGGALLTTFGVLREGTMKCSPTAPLLQPLQGAARRGANGGLEKSCFRKQCPMQNQISPLSRIEIPLSAFNLS